MPTELLDLLKYLIPATFTGIGGILAGVAKYKNSEFNRMNKVLDELQEENRELRKEMRLIRETHAQERANDQAEIRALKLEVAGLRQENADLRRIVVAAGLPVPAHINLNQPQ
jgi:regulator of replication initiation timing